MLLWPFFSLYFILICFSDNDVKVNHCIDYISPGRHRRTAMQIASGQLWHLASWQFYVLYDTISQIITKKTEKSFSCSNARHLFGCVDGE